MFNKFFATQRNATQRNATQRNATQRNATQRNATQRNAKYQILWYLALLLNSFLLLACRNPDDEPEAKLPDAIFSFDKQSKPIIRRDTKTSVNIYYIGENFSHKLPNNDKYKWELKKISEGKGRIEKRGNNFIVSRGNMDRGRDYIISVATATEKKEFLFKVLGQQLRVMSWNIWGKEGYKTNTQPIEPSGGESHHIYGYSYKGKITGQRDRVALLIEENKIDIVGIQESYGQINFLASHTSLSYYYGGAGNLAILSKFPITKQLSGPQLGAEINISAQKKIIFYTSHFTSYKNTSIRNKNVTAAQAIAYDKIYRLPAARGLLNSLQEKTNNADTVPVVITGDHNATSHLDFTAETVGLPQNYGRGVIEFPVSKAFAASGYRDTYRVLQPSPKRHPGLTYSGIYHNWNLKKPTAFLGDESLEKRKYLNDAYHVRIDYIYSQGRKLWPVKSFPIQLFDGKIIIPPRYDKETKVLKKRGIYVFPSDHSAVVTVYEWLD